LLRFSLFLCFFAYSYNVSKGASNVRLSISNEQKITLIAHSALFGQFSPVKGKVISHFGYRGRHMHTGTDIKLQKGDTVRAALSGLVTKAASYFGYGNLVIMKHANGIETYYSHLSKCLVHAGDSVVVAEVIGLGGHTGRATTNHLHFEVRLNHVPKNPENYFDFNNYTNKESVLAYAPVINIKSDSSADVFIKSEQSTDINAANDFVIIQRGDTLYALAKRYGTTVKQLQKLNQMQGSNLKIGKKLIIK